MPALGQTETIDHVTGTSAIHPTPDESAHLRHCSLAPIADFEGWIAKALTGRENQSSSSQAGANCAKHPVGLRAKGLSARRE
jgi:hypothetical protein